LFVLVTDALCQILLRGQQLHIIKGLGLVLHNDLTCSHFLYVDDMIFFLQAEFSNIEVVVWALIVFEALSDIKINYNKTKLVSLNLPAEEASQLATVLGCKISSFPLRYLEVPLSDKKMRKCDWDIMLDKISHKLTNWRGALLSFGGRLTMINVVLSAVPLYTLSLYKMPVLIRKIMDKICCQFFWQGSSSKKSMH
jgi:hypothetical protein